MSNHITHSKSVHLLPQGSKHTQINLYQRTHFNKLEVSRLDSRLSLFVIISSSYICTLSVNICTTLYIGGSRGGMPGACPPYGTQFFRFHIYFHRKVSTSEVHAPLTGARPPTGNPGSATVIDCATDYLTVTFLNSAVTFQCTFNGHQTSRTATVKPAEHS